MAGSEKSTGAFIVIVTGRFTNGDPEALRNSTTLEKRDAWLVPGSSRRSKLSSFTSKPISTASGTSITLTARDRPSTLRRSVGPGGPRLACAG